MAMGSSNGAAARRHAAMLGIGTANPTGILVPQDVFADNLFRVTNSDHLPELKEKLKRICTATATMFLFWTSTTIICMHAFSTKN